MLRPSHEVERIVRKKYEDAIFSKFSVGKYDGAEQVKNVLDTSFEFYESILNEYLEKSASIDMLAFVLSEYDEYYELSNLYKKGELSSEQMKFWEENGNKSKRAIKYLSEQLVNFLPNTPKPNIDHKECFFYCFIACEEMVASYMSSEMAHSIEPNECSLEIRERSNYNFIDYKPTKASEVINNLGINEFLIKLYDYINLNNIKMPFDCDAQAQYLNCVFKETFNMTYIESLSILNELIEICEPKSSEISSVWFNRDRMIAALAIDRSSTGILERDISNVISGFSLSSNNLNDRKIFKPKQEYRLFRRAFLVIPNEHEQLVIFSKAMALESLMQLTSAVCFRKLPTEWLEINCNISKKLDLISNNTGSWFEKILSDEYDSRNIKYLRSLKKIKVNGKNVNIPKGVGEIDFLAIVGNKLHIIECKMVQFASEPRHYLDDIAKYTRGEKSYSAKFSRKIDWVYTNLDDIKLHMEECGLNVFELITVDPIMVTFYPTVAKAFIEKHSCVDFITYCEEELTVKN